MLSKRSLITLLIVVNFLLLAGLLSGRSSPAPVFAQAGGRPGTFISATAKASGNNYETVFLLDVPQRKLYALYPVSAQTHQLVAVPPRDLAEDFQRN